MNISVKPIEVILPRLDNKKSYREGWRADCPARQHKSRNTLWISERDDGSIGMHCFAGCEPLEVLHAIGLELRDLFPKSMEDRSPRERNERRQFGRIAKYEAARSSLERAARIIWVAGLQLRAGESLNSIDEQQLDSAIETIETAGKVLNGDS